MIKNLRDFIALLPNWFTSFLVGLVVGSLVYLSTNQTWGWHDGIAFVAGFTLNWITTHIAENPQPNPLGINWKPQDNSNSEVK